VNFNNQSKKKGNLIILIIASINLLVLIFTLSLILNLVYKVSIDPGFPFNAKWLGLFFLLLLFELMIGLVLIANVQYFATGKFPESMKSFHSSLLTNLQGKYSSGGKKFFMRYMIFALVINIANLIFIIALIIGFLYTWNEAQISDLQLATTISFVSILYASYISYQINLWHVIVTGRSIKSIKDLKDWKKI